jgi:FkbM family methyltransferase
MKTTINLIKNIIRECMVQLEILRRPAIRYCIHNELLPSLLARTPSNIIREMMELPPSEHQTQLNQDIFALLMNRFRPGFFLEIGANDGFTFSNTVYLENEFGWRGVLIEANNKYLESLTRRKNSIIVNKAVSSQDGEADFIDAGLYGGLKSALDVAHYLQTKDATCIKVDCMGLQKILDSVAAPDFIDFVSIDVEGGELPIVEQLVAVNRRFRCGCIEYNDRIADYEKMVRLLEKAGYRVAWKGQTEQDLFFVDTLTLQRHIAK